MIGLGTLSLLFGLSSVAAPISQKPASVRVINAVADREQLAFAVGDGFWEAIPYGQRTRYEEIDVARQLTPAYVLMRRGERISNEVPIKLQPAYPHTVIFTGFVGATGNFKPVVIRDSTAGKPSASSVQIQHINAMSDEIPISIRFDGSAPSRFQSLKFGEQTPFIGYGAREYNVTLQDTKGTALFSTKFRTFGGTRYTAIAMGAVGGEGNRGPRVFFYTF